MLCRRKFPVYISQDGTDAAVKGLAAGLVRKHSSVIVQHLVHRQEAAGPKDEDRRAMKCATSYIPCNFTALPVPSSGPLMECTSLDCRLAMSA